MKYSYNSSFRMPNKKIMAVSAAIVVIVLFGILFSSGITGMGILDRTPAKIVENQVEDVDLYEEVEEPLCVPVEEIYTELEPYTETECITVPTVITVNATQELRYEVNKECYWSNDLQTLNTKCTIRNSDDQEGKFIIEVGVVNKNDERIGEERSVDVHAQSSAEIRYSYDLDMGTCYCAIIEVPAKEIRYDKIINNEECFELNKYREVEKTRIIEDC